MKIHPILFSDEMVRAILDGRKTRRVVALTDFGLSTTRGYDFEFRDRRHLWNSVSLTRALSMCPYGHLGDELYVREAWGLRAYCDTGDWNRDSIKGLSQDDVTEQWLVDYRAEWGSNQEVCFWRPGIHMPRWASRIRLRVTDVRIQKLDHISEDDAKAEGCSPSLNEHGASYVSGFRVLWDRINAARGFGWDENPWVWAISFDHVRAEEAL